jgi:hypothetical protein
LEEDLFNGYGAGMMSPGRIAQLAVAGRPSKSPFPTFGELLSKQTDAVLPSSSVSSQVKSSPITVPDLTVQTLEKELVPVTNNISTSNNSTVNNSFDYSLAEFPEPAKSIINNILSTLSETYAQEEVVNSKFNSMTALSMSPSTVVNQINKSFDIPKQSTGIGQNISKTGFVNSMVSSILNLVNTPIQPEAAPKLTPTPSIEARPGTFPSLTPTSIVNTVVRPVPRQDTGLASTENRTQPISSNSMQIMNKAVTKPAASYADSIYSLINMLGPSMTSLAESNKVESIDESSIDATSNSLSAVDNSQSVTNNALQNSQSINTKQYGNDITVKSTNPIKNKSLVNQILNPPNQVAQGVDNLGKVITSTTNTMTSSITDKLSTLTPPAQTESVLANQIVNNNSSNTVNQSSQLAQPAVTEAKPTEEMAGNSMGLSEYYLQAIHDSLIIHGIKIRTI